MRFCPANKKKTSKICGQNHSKSLMRCYVYWPNICGEKVLFKVYKNNIMFWEVGTVKERVWELVYIIQGLNNIHKHYLNHLRKHRVYDSNVSPPQICEEPIDTIFENFDFDPPQPSTLEEIGYTIDIRLISKPSLPHHFSLYLVTSIYL